MLIGIDASRTVIAKRTGTEFYSLYLIRALLTRGEGRHHFRLYFNHPPQEELFPRNERVEWRILPFPRLWTHIRLAWEILWHPPDVLFVPAHVIPLTRPWRSVVTIHDLGYLYHPQMHTRWTRWYLDLTTRLQVKVANRVIVDSDATRQDLIRWYHADPRRLVLAYPAGKPHMKRVMDSQRIAAVKERYGTGECYFLYVGTIQPRKNLHTLLAAFQRAHAQRRLAPNVRLVLAGKVGWLANSILAEAYASGPKERIVLTGYIPDQDLAALMSGALAYILPSWHEGFGMPVVEAMACGTPVICSNASALPEIAGDAALLFNPSDPDELAEAMVQVCGQPELRKRLITRGYARARMFSWDACAARVLEALEAVGAR